MTELLLTAGDRCGDCPGSGLYVCHCMKLTAEALIETIETYEICSLRELRLRCGAGDGCMACRQRLQRYIEEYAPPTVPARPAAIALAVVA